MDSVARTLTTTVMTAVALAGMHGSATAQMPICVVIQDHASVNHAVLGIAIQTVTDVYRPLGIGIA